MVRGSRYFLAVILCATSGALLSPRPVVAQPNGGGMNINPQATLADEGPSWTALIDLRNKTANATVQEKVDAHEALFKAHPEMNPLVASVLLQDVANWYRNDLKNPDKAMQVLDWGLEKYKQDDGSISLIESKGRGLLDAGKADEAASLMEDNWPLITSMAHVTHFHLRSMASRSVQIRVQALQKQNKNAEALTLMQETLSASPALLDPATQIDANWQQGWLYGALVDSAIAAKKYDEASRWARLAFAESNFDKDAIERATSLVGRVWAAQDDFVAARAFGAAQTDATRANPLGKVALPVLSADFLEEELQRLQNEQEKSYDRERAPQIVTVLIALGQLRPAMTVARELLTKFPTAPEGVQQVARVFKAADSSLVRANQFIAYLDGKAENPLPAFMQEADIAPGTVPKPTAPNATVAAATDAKATP